jgi:formate dehydrogenase subunit delta
MHGLAEDIVRMGNQIARQFAHLSEDEAVTAVANHLRNFWAPQMRAGLVDIVDEGDEVLEPVLAEAAELLRGS